MSADADMRAWLWTTVGCPKCGAGPAEPCRVYEVGFVHMARADAAASAVDAERSQQPVRYMTERPNPIRIECGTSRRLMLAVYGMFGAFSGACIAVIVRHVT